MRLMPQEDLGKRRGRSERTKTLDVIQKVDIVYMYFLNFSHNLGDILDGIPVCAAASVGASQEGLEPEAGM